MKRIWACLFWITLAGAAGAQQQPDAPVVSGTGVATTILTMDLDGLFARSAFGERIGREFQAGNEALNTENRVIADALRQEELALAAQRPSMAPDLFRAEAEAFDEKAQAIRRAQDAKRRALDDTLNTGREQFLLVTRPVLEQLMVDSRAVVILERRTVVMSLGAIDITDIAIERINDAIGDGAGLVAQDPAPQTGVTPEQ